MHWLVLTAIGALANAAFVLLWKQASGRADTMALIAFNNILAGLLVLAYTMGWQNLKLQWDTQTLLLLGGLVFSNLFIIVFFSLALKAGPVSYVNPVFSGILNVSLVLLAVVIFAEKITLQSGLGIATVLIGATMIALA
jgi:uncharacterized membrane protein